MRFATMLVASSVFTMAAQSLPMGQGTAELAGDKRDLHDLCGRWFCGHTKRDEITPESPVESPTTNTDPKLLTRIEKQIVREQSPTTSDKRDLHDLCGRWFCGHTRKRSAFHRTYLRSSMKEITHHSSS
ncbi:hypothetical protein K7432_016715 [Basidiobolus ranarum]|uniref:Uncharacterized protein n=1 Tax=Basidiobolus ranarum TaxID=34480 RepID=A0ABR2VLE9_9FUNG